MHLLIGAGNSRIKKLGGGAWSDLVTLDIDPGTNPDVVWDLNDVPLPFAADTFVQVHAYDVLEHVGRQGDWKWWFAFHDAVWRILKPGGQFWAKVPRHDSVWAWGDPGHTRVILKEQLVFLHRPAYAQVGATPMTDYRPFFEGDWNIAAEHDATCLMFCLTAVKPARG